MECSCSCETILILILVVRLMETWSKLLGNHLSSCAANGDLIKVIGERSCMMTLSLRLSTPITVIVLPSLIKLFDIQSELISDHIHY